MRKRCSHHATPACLALNGLWACVVPTGSIADLIIVVARTGGADTPRHKALSLFLVPTVTRGFRCTRVLRKLALHARDVCEIQLDDVVVPATALLGEAGGAFTCLMKNLARVRCRHQPHRVSHPPITDSRSPPGFVNTIAGTHGSGPVGGGFVRGGAGPDA